MNSSLFPPTFNFYSQSCLSQFFLLKCSQKKILLVIIVYCTSINLNMAIWEPLHQAKSLFHNFKYWRPRNYLILILNSSREKKINFSCIKAWELGGFRFFFHRPNLIQASSCFPSQSNDKSLFVLQQNYIINSLNVSFFTQVVVVLFEFDQSCCKYVSKW